MAVKLEQKSPSSEILERYLNTIYFGRGAYGVQAASRAYFGKDVGELGLPGGGLLAGLIRTPAAPSRTPHTEEAKRRRRTVLDAMLEEGMITPAEHRRADTWPFSPFHGLTIWTPSQGVDVLKGGDPSSPTVRGHEYFVEYVRKELERRYGEDTLYGGGLRVYTTLDPDMQQAAYDAVTGTLDQPERPRRRPGGHRRRRARSRPWWAAATATPSESKVNLAVGERGRRHRAPAGLDVQAVRAGRGGPRGLLGRLDFRAPSEITFADKANDGEDWDGQRRRVRGGRIDLVDATEKSVNTVYAQLMVEARGRERRRTWPRSWASPPSSSRQLARARAPARCRCSTWPPPTRPSPTAACASTPTDDRAGRAGRRRPWSTTSRPTRDAGARPPTRPTWSTTSSSQVVERGTGAGGQHRPAGGRQDRHHAGQRRRLVRRLHAASSPPRCGWATRGQRQPTDGRRPRPRGSPAARCRRRSGSGSCSAATAGIDTGAFPRRPTFPGTSSSATDLDAATLAATTAAARPTTAPPGDRAPTTHAPDAPTTTTRDDGPTTDVDRPATADRRR